jgi:hypothetical protein
MLRLWSCPSASASDTPAAAKKKYHGFVLFSVDTKIVAVGQLNNNRDSKQQWVVCITKEIVSDDGLFVLCIGIGYYEKIAWVLGFEGWRERTRESQVLVALPLPKVKLEVT